MESAKLMVIKPFVDALFLYLKQQEPTVQKSWQRRKTYTYTLKQVADDMIFFFCEDYDHNGLLEAFGATNVLGDFGLYPGVPLYYVSYLGDVFY